MPNYLFYAHEGLTYTPSLEDYQEGGELIENLQIIGFSASETAEEAFEELLQTDAWLLETTFEELTAIELAKEENSRDYFSLESIREKEREEKDEEGRKYL